MSNASTAIQSLGLAVLTALLAVFLALQVSTNSGTGLGDPHPDSVDWYLGYAFNMIDGNGYAYCGADLPDLRCPPNTIEDRAEVVPGYPIFLTGALLVFGEDPVAAVQLLQAVMTGAIMFLTVMLAARWGLGAAAIAGGIILLSGSMYHSQMLLMTETLFMLFLLVFVHLLLRARRPAGFLLAGVCLTGAMFTKALLVLTLPLIVLVMPRRRGVLLAFVPLLIVIGLWTYRNYTVLDSFVPLTTGTGEVLWGANNEYVYNSRPGAWFNDGWFEEMRDQMAGLSEIEANQFLTGEALDYIFSVDPLQLTFVLSAKVMAWFGLWDADLWQRLPVLLVLASGLFLLYRAIQSRPFRREIAQLWQDPAIRLLCALIAGALLNTLIFYGSARFRLPYEPYLAILAGVGLTTWWQFKQKREALKLSIQQRGTA